MATRQLSSFGFTRTALVVSLLGSALGCQQSHPLASRRLIEHVAMIDFSGLKPPEKVDNVKTTLALPRNWEAMPAKSTALYTHRQWRSPSGHTGVGVAYARTPLPLSPKLVVWLAKQQYAKLAQDGRVLGEWTDNLGRYWFEAENDKYHIRGYVATQDFGAWILYVGYRVKYAPDPGEISLAARSLDSALPQLEEPTNSPATQPATAP